MVSNIKESNTSRIVEGIIAQCKKYDYDLSVFSTTTTLQYFKQSYADGAANIYNLIQFDSFDGIIVDTLTLSSAPKDILSDIYKRIEEAAKGPVVNLATEYGGYKTVVSQDEDVLRSMCRHMIEKHGYRKIYILTGVEGTTEAENRLKIMKNEIESHGICVSDDQIFYGDFWYSSGENLADRIASGEVACPEAIICASNHMGLGLLNRLIKHGYKIPEDVAIIAFDSVELSKLNEVTLASFDSNVIGTAAQAVDYIRSVIEPDQELQPYEFVPEQYFNPGDSCGCGTDHSNIIKQFGVSLYRAERNYGAEDMLDNIDIGYLLEGDCYERLCASKDIEDCIYNILETSYNILPFRAFYLCLRELWEDFNEDISSGFPDKMKMVLKRDEMTKNHFHSNKDGMVFDTKEMLPGLLEAREEPSVFYFTSVHFNDTIFGYAVLQRRLSDKLVNIVFRNWIRFVCSSLEMIRIRETYVHRSLKDSMTGMTNKRGMYEALEQMLQNIRPEESIYVAVIDMDGLKFINDTFGHVEGDACLKRLSHVINLVTKNNEISVRAGGDEFYVIGVGEYSEETLETKVHEFEQAIQENGEFEGKEYRLSASIGNTLWHQEKDFDIDRIIQIADKRMYDYKVAHKKNRK